MKYVTTINKQTKQTRATLQHRRQQHRQQRRQQRRQHRRRRKLTLSPTLCCCLEQESGKGK